MKFINKRSQFSIIFLGCADARHEGILPEGGSGLNAGLAGMFYFYGYLFDSGWSGGWSTF